MDHFIRLALATELVFLVLSSVYIIYLATTGDTTLLGDPFYEDQIMANQRAFAAWALALINLAISGTVGLLLLWKHLRKRFK